MNTDIRKQRDPRLDVLRGFALLTIFVDHVPGNALGLLTLRNFGFADAAELFVALAGVSCALAYGRCFEREGVAAGLRRVAARCARIYGYQVALLMLSLATVNAWCVHFQRPELAPFAINGMAVAARGIVLQALPPGLDILPLYVILICWFPLAWAGVRQSKLLTLAASASLWLAANACPSLNLTNAIDGRGWFFNPFAWQLLFVGGIVAGTVLPTDGASLPRLPRLEGLCWGYIGLGVLAAAPWATWGLWDFQPIVVTPTQKTNLSPFRLLHIAALMYLALSSPRLGDLMRSRWCSGLDACGRHSLEIFALGTLLALLATLVVSTFSVTWPMWIAINAIGLGTLLAAARALESGCIKKRLGRVNAFIGVDMKGRFVLRPAYRDSTRHGGT